MDLKYANYFKFKENKNQGAHLDLGPYHLFKPGYNIDGWINATF